MVLRNILFPRAGQWFKELHAALKPHSLAMSATETDAVSRNAMKGESIAE
jgi:hypothetical protein